MATQLERVVKAARSFRGVCQVDFLGADTIDGGKPITRLAARIQEAEERGYVFESLGTRSSTKVYRLVSEPDGAPTRSTVEIPLSNGGVAIVDPEDAHLAQWSWHRNSDGHAMRSSSGRTIFLHREILGLAHGDGKQGDHRDRDKLNNRRSNLRVATHAENGQNRPSQAGSSQYRGVSWEPRRQRWFAQARLDHENYYLGHFEVEVEAARSAEAFRRTHMPFATPETSLDPVPACRCKRCKTPSPPSADQDALFTSPSRQHWQDEAA